MTPKKKANKFPYRGWVIPIYTSKKLDSIEFDSVILCHEYFSQGYVGVREEVEEYFTRHSLNPALKIPIGDNLSIAIIKP